MTGPDEHVLFISHTAADKPFAVAIRDAIEGLVGERISVRFSSGADEEAPRGGEDWRKWIYEQVVAARVTLVVVTPGAIGRPWLLWEAGACFGAGLVSGPLAQSADDLDAAESVTQSITGDRLVTTIAFGLQQDECPDPLRGGQILRGTSLEAMSDFWFTVFDAFDFPASIQRKAAAQAQEITTAYKQAVDAAMLATSSLVTEANVQDWLERLRSLEADGDDGIPALSELKDFEHWMRRAFARDWSSPEARDVPIDVRLHRKLGEHYLAHQAYGRAVNQLRSARRTAPRDIFVLRPLGEAWIKEHLEPREKEQVIVSGDDERNGQNPERDNGDDNNVENDVQELIRTIEDLDKRAFTRDPNLSALRAKFQRRVQRDVDGAIETLLKSLAENEGSSYLRDVLAQAYLEANKYEEARQRYVEVIEILDTSGASDKWSHATRATARLVLDGVAEALPYVEKVAASDATPDQIASVRKGLAEVGRELELPEDELSELLRALS